MTFQPYQEAAQEERRQGELPLKLAKKAGYLAATFAGGAGSLFRILPLLSKYIPEKFAKKGLEKIDTRWSKYFNAAEKEGHPFDQAREFVLEKMKPAIEEEERKLSPEEKRVQTLGKFNQRIRKQPSELSRESLTQQFQESQGQGQPGKAALLQTMQEITNLLRGMRGQGG